MNSDDEDEDQRSDEEPEDEDYDFTIDVHVVNRNGDPEEGVEVVAVFQYDDPLTNFFHCNREVGTSDEDGHVTFDLSKKRDTVIFHCRGEDFGPYDCDDGDSYTLEICNG